MDAASIIAAIVAGDFDEDLADIVEAVRQRAREGAVEPMWRIDFEGIEITEENLTVAEARIVQAALKTPVIKLKVFDDEEAIASIVIAALMSRSGLKGDQAAEVVGRWTARNLRKAATQYFVTDPPKDGGQ